MNEPAVSPNQAQEATLPASASGWLAQSGRQNLVVITGMFIFCLLLWLPFGFKTTGLMEEWMIIHDWDVGGDSEQNQDVALFVTSGTLAMRPMDPTVFILGHIITPDSFLGYNVYTLLTFFFKGLLLYAILCKLLPGNVLFAFAASLLFIIFPADDGLFTFRAMNIHTSLCLYLLATYLLLSFYEKPHILKLIVMWLSILVSLFTYELAHPLVAFTPFILLWKDRRLSSRLLRVSFLWWLAPLIAFLYAAIAFVSGDTYQAWVLARSGLRSEGILGEIATSMWMAYRRHFVDGWIHGAQLIDPASRLFPYALAMFAVAAASIAARLTSARQSQPGNHRRYIELFLIGIGVIFLSYVVYMITPYRQLTWRVFYFSAIGGACCIAVLVYFISRRFQNWQVVFAIGMSLLIGLAGVRALDQHQYYVNLSILQQRLLKGIARTVPAFTSPATLVVVDETGRFENNWTLGTSYLVENALRYVYNDYSLQAILCHFDPQAGTFETLPELRERCEFAPDELRQYREGELAEAETYDQVIVVRYTDEGVTLLESLPPAYLNAGGADAYHPTALIDANSAPPYRYNTLFSILD